MISLQNVPFDDVAGAEAVATVPVSDRLVNELIARDMPQGGAVRQVVVQSEAGNRLKARVTLRAGFMPPINITAQIEEQPSLPASPVLVLRLSGLGGLMGFAGTVAGLANVLPPGIRMESDRVFVNVQTLAQERGAGVLMKHVQELFVTTQPGRIVLSFRLRVRSSAE